MPADSPWWHLADRPTARSRLQRRAFPIAAYVGPNGSGKSALMVYDTIPSLDHGRPALSTVRLLDFRNPRPCPGGAACDDPDNHELRRNRWVLGETDDGSGPVLRCETFATGEVHQAPHPFYVPFRSYTQLIDWRDGDVLMDEVTGIASSREVSSLPVQVANYLVQLRRRNVVLRWSAPAWGRADKIIREVSQQVNFCVGMMPKARPTPEGEAPRLWTDKRAFYVRSFDPLGFDEFEAHRVDMMEPESRALYWRPKALLEKAYDTLDPVLALGWANESGMCMGCGGRRSVTKCSCSDHGKTTAPVRGRGARVAQVPVAEQGTGETGVPADPSSPPPLTHHPLIAALDDGTLPLTTA